VYNTEADVDAALQALLRWQPGPDPLQPARPAPGLARSGRLTRCRLGLDVVAAPSRRW